MAQHFEQALTIMEETVHQLAAQVPPAQLVRCAGLDVFRYEEKSIRQAIIQKLARMVSTLYAARLLLDHGYFQEVCSLQRILDELNDDVFFLTTGVDNLTDLHKKYLDAFYEEEFDSDDPLQSTQKRKVIPRRKIHAHTARVLASFPGSKVDPSTASKISRTLHKTYSGYVHAASPQIMDMYEGGPPPRFCMRGLRRAPPWYQARRKQDLTHYFCRGLFTVAISTAAFDSLDQFDGLRKYAGWFDSTFRKSHL